VKENKSVLEEQITTYLKSREAKQESSMNNTEERLSPD
jgi:hypothetical protein